MNLKPITKDEKMNLFEECVHLIRTHAANFYDVSQEEFADLEKSRVFFKEYAQDLPFVTSILTEKGINAVLLGDFNLAYRMFKDAIEMDTPGNPYLMQYLCFMYLTQSSFAQYVTHDYEEKFYKVLNQKLSHVEYTENESSQLFASFLTDRILLNARFNKELAELGIPKDDLLKYTEPMYFLEKLAKADEKAYPKLTPIEIKDIEDTESTGDKLTLPVDKTLNQYIKKALSGLSEDERKILELRFGVTAEVPPAQEE